jgi:predicted regulator of Ras-like GTPase activity (Roadblock/LC7/MglB family)
LELENFVVFIRLAQIKLVNIRVKNMSYRSFNGGMKMSRFQILRDQALDILKDMQEGNPAIEFSTLTYADGRLLATTLTEKVDRCLVACAETITFHISSNLANHLTQGEVKKILISGDKGNILIQGVGSLMVLSTVIKKSASIKKVMSVIEKHLEALRGIEESYGAILKQYYLPQESLISASNIDELPVQAE